MRVKSERGLQTQDTGLCKYVSATEKKASLIGWAENGERWQEKYVENKKFTHKKCDFCRDAICATMFFVTGISYELRMSLCVT